MTEQTNLEDKIRALIHQWEEINCDELCQVSAAGVLNELRDLLPDPPLPGPLFLAKATHPEYGEGVVTSHFPDGGGTVRFTFSDEAIVDGTSHHWVFPSDLTFHTPDHPEFLKSEEDYRSAPEGTIVAEDECGAFVLLDGLWGYVDTYRSDHEGMAGLRRRVLRWGWEA